MQDHGKITLDGLWEGVTATCQVQIRTLPPGDYFFFFFLYLLVERKVTWGTNDSEWNWNSDGENKLSMFLKELSDIIQGRDEFLKKEFHNLYAPTEKAIMPTKCPSDQE